MPTTVLPPPYNLMLSDSRSRNWFFTLKDRPQVHFLTSEQFSIVINAEGRRIGDFDEQRTWEGGRGGERFSDDPTKYKDAKEACTWIPGHVFPSLQWNISKGFRDAEHELPGSVSWESLIGTKQSISTAVVASASSNREKAWLWIKKVGSPGTLTVEWRTNSGGSPSSTISKTVDVTAAGVNDTISQFVEFDWTGVTAVTSGTTYHLVACGADTDNALNHWEVGVNAVGAGSKYSASGAADAGSWTAAAFTMCYRVHAEQSGTIRRWFFFQGSNFCMVSDEATAAVHVWNETTDLWEVIAPGTHGLGQVTGRPIEVNGFVYFPQGDTVAIRVWNGTLWDSQTIATGQGCATGLAVGYSAADNKTQIWRWNNALVSGGTTTGLKVSVSRADAVALYTTDLAFRASIQVGDTSSPINFAKSINNDLYVTRSNSFGTVSNDRYTELDYGQRKTPSSDNGIVIESWNSFTFFNWLFSFERLYGGTVDDVGQGFKNNTLPDGREGVVCSFATYVAWMFYAIDAGASGTSSVMLYDGLNHHEVARAWGAGRRIRDVFIQPVSGARNRLWFESNGEPLYIELPLNKGNPLDDPGAKYMHEFVVESSEIDMGTASKLPKFIKEMTMTSKNLNGAGIKVAFDYQLDDKVGTTEWTDPERSFLRSPEDTVKMNTGNIRKFAYRLRASTDNQLIPPDIRGIVPNGFARSTQRRVLECTADIKNTTVNGKPQLAKDVITWLEEVAESASLVHVTSEYNDYDEFDALVSPPTLYPIKSEPTRDTVTFTLLVL